MISQVGCHLPGRTSPSEAFQELASLFLDSQTFPGFFCTFPAPSVAVAFNNCSFTHTHAQSASEDLSLPFPDSLLTPLLSTAHLGNVPGGCCLLHAAWQAWARWLCCPGTCVGLAVEFDVSPVPPSFLELATMDLFSSHSLCRYYICHFPGCFCRRAGHAAHTSGNAPAWLLSALGPASSPHLTARSMQAVLLISPVLCSPINSDLAYQPIRPTRPSIVTQPLHKVRPRGSPVLRGLQKWWVSP